MYKLTIHVITKPFYTFILLFDNSRDDERLPIFTGQNRLFTLSLPMSNF